MEFWKKEHFFGNARIRRRANKDAKKEEKEEEEKKPEKIEYRTENYVCILRFILLFRFFPFTRFMFEKLNLKVNKKK